MINRKRNGISNESYSTVVCLLVQIGKAKEIDTWVSHELSDL